MTHNADLLDNDLYNFTMQNAILDHFPDTLVKYKFIDRQHNKYSDGFLKSFTHEVEALSTATVKSEHLALLKRKAPYLDRHYFAYLHDYRYDPNELSYGINADGEFWLEISGLWATTKLWDVPLLARISETYLDINTNMQPTLSDGYSDRLSQNIRKAHRLDSHGCQFAEFGTRRRRDQNIQNEVISCLKQYPSFRGTSNVMLGLRHGVPLVGTMAHEWIMGVSAIDGLVAANRCALHRWNETFKGNLGIALTDTFGTDAFFKDFDGELARLYDGVRHDSGDPIEFGHRAIDHYEKLGIKPTKKMVVFTDALTVDKAIKIQQEFEGSIGVSFGIGTHFTNDLPGVRPMNIVIKLIECNHMPVVKLSDEPGKATGDKDALRVARWTFNRIPLNA